MRRSRTSRTIFYGKDFPGLHNVGEPDVPGYYVAYVRHSDEQLRVALNDAIAKAIADETLKRIYEKYGVWNRDQERLAKVGKSWPPTVSDAGGSRWANMPEYIKLLLKAAWTTVELSFLSMPLAIAIGLLVAIGRLYGPRGSAFRLKCTWKPCAVRRCCCSCSSSITWCRN